MAAKVPSNANRHDVRTPTDASYLRDLFNISARYYDSVNRITSLGQVDSWRKEVVRAAGLRPGDQVLDAFSGPGGLSAEAVPHLGADGRLVLADLSPVMLHQARKRIAPVLAARGVDRPRVDYLVGDLLRDDLGLSGFDVVLLGWGLRYVPDVSSALVRMRFFLRPGGRLVVLEFTRPPAISWATPAHLYFRYLLPRIGSWLAEDRELHDYLSLSAANFLRASELVETMRAADLSIRSCRSHLDGLVTVVAADA